MANFYVSVQEKTIADQVADMINLYNRWSIKFSGQSITMLPANYFVEVYGGKVVGCASSIQEYPTLTKIQHICVLPEYRNKGIAKKLVNMVISRCGTENIYMTIREDNRASIQMAQSLGFVFTTKTWFRDHWTLTFGRRR